MFERAYDYVVIDKKENISEAITAEVAARDIDRASASLIGFQIVPGVGLAIVIEKWRNNGNEKQNAAGEVDAASTHGTGRRTRKG